MLAIAVVPVLIADAIHYYQDNSETSEEEVE